MVKKGNGILITVLLCIFTVLMFSWLDTEYERRTSKETTLMDDVVVYENAWIVKLSEGKALLYSNGFFHELPVNSNANISEVMADVTVTNGNITRVGIKDNVIEGKVLAVTEEYVEIEGYGKVRVADNASVIKNYGELENADITDVVVGYTSQKIIMNDDEICGVIINEPVMSNIIRVLIMTDNYGSYYHDKVSVSSDSVLILNKEGRVEEYTAEDVLTFESDELKEGARLTIKSRDIEGKIKLKSVNRQCGNPEYRGSIELVRTSEGILIINELSLEEYLYAVVPSEMPSSYSIEALKAQAVCARSYAYRQMLDNKLGSYGAHVNDSSQYQVYNNIGEHESAVRAVDETRGQILTYEGEVVEAYYFSTSCGHTTDAGIWGGANPGYIKGILINGGDAELILDTEEKFAEFIKNKRFESYDMAHEWYRWEVEFSSDTINKLLKKVGLYDTVGNIEKLETVSRETGGIVDVLKVVGQKGSILIENEYTIRQFLCPYGIDIIRNDGTSVDNFNLLPSAYFVIETSTIKGVQSYHVYGGGFGHGVGMSQKGANSMAASGYLYDEILKFFYNDISISDCYYEE